MGALKTYLVSEMITDMRYELRDTNTTYQYADAELLVYINDISENIHQILIDNESEMVRNGSGTITTVAGTQSYDLGANTMGDLWVPHRVWVDTKEPMTMCEEWELFDSINLEEDSQTGHRAEPWKYCIIEDYIWFKEVPDAAYTVRLKYYPNYVDLATSDACPFRHIFNQDIKKGAALLAKNRNEMDVQIDAVLKDFYEQVSQKVMKRRRFKPVSVSPAKRRSRRGFNYGRTARLGGGRR